MSHTQAVAGDLRAQAPPPPSQLPCCSTLGVIWLQSAGFNLTVTAGLQQQCSMLAHRPPKLTHSPSNPIRGCMGDPRQLKHTHTVYFPSSFSMVHRAIREAAIRRWERDADRDEAGGVVIPLSGPFSQEQHSRQTNNGDSRGGVLQGARGPGHWSWDPEKASDHEMRQNQRAQTVCVCVCSRERDKDAAVCLSVGSVYH